MKNIIKTIIASVFALVLMTGSAHAQAVFNNPGEMPTVTIANSTRTVCNYGPINNCWQTSTTAQAGDVVAVHLYYHNTSNVAAQGTTLGMNPQSSGAVTTLSLRGGIASLSGPRLVGSASLSISSPQTVTYIPGSAKWYPSATSGTRSVDESALFGTSGFNIGTVNPGEQGVLVAFFKVGNDVVNNTYQCNDGIDNDGDGRIDYPNDPGCSSTLDNDEYNVVNQTYQCNDGYDNDGDGRVDYPNDPGCYSYTDNDEYNQVINQTYQCNDGYDNDGDGLRDYPNDPGCSSYYDDSEYNQNQNYTYQCNDGYDNDGDGLRDYPSDPGCSTYNDDSEYDQVINNTRPQAITTNASSVGQNTARLNGIAVPNTSYPTTAWFEWGTSGSFGSRTSAQSVNANTSTYISDTISGLTPGTIYYYRTVVQNQNGIAYGEPVRFQAQTGTVIINNPPVKVITKVITKKDVVVANSAPSLLELRVENIYDRMCVNGEMDYTVTYRNISGQTLQNAVLRVTHPKELTFINSSRGDYEVVDRTVTIALGDIPAGGSGTLQVRARVNNSAVVGNLAVTTATVVYTNTNTRAQEDAIAYSLVTVSNDCPNTNNLGASAFGIASFFPHTLLGWLLLILVILALIVLGRQFYKKKEQ